MHKSVAAVSIVFLIAMACGSGGESERESEGESGEVPFSFRVDPVGVDAPRGNLTKHAVVTVSRKPGFTADIGFLVNGLPKEIRAYGPSFYAGDDRLGIGLLPQSDAPTGTFQAELLAVAVEEDGTSWAVSDTMLVTPTAMERPPNSNTECEAHWGPIIQGTRDADGWKAVSRLKDGEPGDFPDELYKEWWFSYEPHGPGYRNQLAREVLVRAKDGLAEGGRASATITFDEKKGCKLTVEPFDPRDIGRYMGEYRSWIFVDHRVAAPTPEEQLIISGQYVGIDLKYIPPVYELTLVRAQLPPLED